LILVFDLPTDQEMRHLISHFACANEVVSSVTFLNSIAKDAKGRSDFTQTFWENIEDYKPNSVEFMKEVLLMANKLALKNYKDQRSFLANIPIKLLIKKGILLQKPKYSEKIIKLRPSKGYRQTVYVRKKCA
ncbi:MAG TPA: hypothetical protein PK886_02395, partial [Candidatus Paceibacterota bacterium]|nr:hypothetical protein [Candidatus Paceibacterota bacterium]